jgi:chromosome segregation ATPase
MDPIARVSQRDALAESAQHKADRDEFVASILEKTKSKGRLQAKPVDAGNNSSRAQEDVPRSPVGRQVSFSNKTQVDRIFESALATPPPVARSVYQTEESVVKSPRLVSNASTPHRDFDGLNNKNSLVLENTIVVKSGHDMELPVEIIIPQNSVGRVSCDVKYKFSTDHGDITWTMLHSKGGTDGSSNNKNEYSDGIAHAARTRGSEYEVLQPLQRVDTGKAPASGSLALSESCHVVLRWSNQFSHKKPQRLSYLVSMTYRDVNDNGDDGATPASPMVSAVASRGPVGTPVGTPMGRVNASPSWAHADRLEEVEPGTGNEEQEEDPVPEGDVVRLLRNHITELEHQLFSVLDHNAKVHAEDEAQLNAFGALVDRYKSGQDASRIALKEYEKQNKWLRSAVKRQQKQKQSSSTAAATTTAAGGYNYPHSVTAAATTAATTTTADAAQEASTEGGSVAAMNDKSEKDSEEEAGDDDDIIPSGDEEEGEDDGARVVPSVADFIRGGALASSQLPRPLQDAFDSLEEHQARLDAAEQRMMQERSSHHKHEQQLASNHHFYTNAVRLKLLEVESLTHEKERQHAELEVAWAEVEKSYALVEEERASTKKADIRCSRLEEDIAGLQGRLKSTGDDVEALRRKLQQTVDEHAVVLAEHKKSHEDKDAFHEKQCAHLYDQVMKHKEDTDREKAAHVKARTDLQEAERGAAELVRMRDADIKRLSEIHEEEKQKLAIAKDEEHGARKEELLASHQQQLAMAHAAHATSAAALLSSSSSVAGGSPASHLGATLESLAAADTPGASSAVTAATLSSAGLAAQHLSATNEVATATARARDAEAALEKVRSSSKAREGRLLAHYETLNDKYSDLLLKLESQEALLAAKEEEVGTAQMLLAQSTHALAELKYKASKHDEMAEMNRSLSEGLLLLKEEHSRTRQDLSSHASELTASRRREQEQTEKISLMDANSPRKLMDRNKMVIEGLQKDLARVTEEKESLLRMVEQLNTEKHARDDDHAKDTLEASTSINTLNRDVAKLQDKNAELEVQVAGLLDKASRLRAAEEKASDLADENADLAIAAKRTDSAIRRLEEERGTLTEQAQKVAASFEEAQDRIRQLGEEKAALAEAKADADVAVRRGEGAVRKLESEIEGMAEQARKASTSLETNSERVRQLGEEKVAIAVENTDLKAAVKMADSTIRRLESEVEGLMEQIRKASITSEETNDRIRQLGEEKAALSEEKADAEAALRRAEGAFKKLEVEVVARTDDARKANNSLVDSLERSRLLDEERAEQETRMKSLVMNNARLEKQTAALEAMYHEAAEEQKARHERLQGEKSYANERELRHMQEEYARAQAAFETKLALMSRRLEEAEEASTRDIELAVKKVEHKHAVETENQMQKHDAKLEELRLGHSLAIDEVKIRHSRALEAEREEQGELVKALEIERAKMKAALQGLREEEKNELKLLEMRNTANAALHSQVETLKGEIESLQARYDGQRNVVVKLKAQLLTQTEKVNEEDVELRVLREERSGAETRTAAMQSDLDSARNRASELQRTVEVLREEVRRGEELLAAMKDATSAQRTELAGALLALRRADEDAEAVEVAHRQQVERMELENDTLLSMVNQTKAALAADEARLKRMTEAQKAADRDQERRRAAAAAAAAEPVMSPQTSPVHSLPTSPEIRSVSGSLPNTALQFGDVSPATTNFASTTTFPASSSPSMSAHDAAASPAAASTLAIVVDSPTMSRSSSSASSATTPALGTDSSSRSSASPSTNAITTSPSTATGHSPQHGGTYNVLCSSFCFLFEMSLSLS